MEKKKYNITVGNETKEFEEGTTYQAVAKEFCGSFSHPAVLAVEGENRLQELRKTVEKNCERQQMQSDMKLIKEVCAFFL